MAMLGVASCALFALTILAGAIPRVGARCLPVASSCSPGVYAAGVARVWRDAGYGRGISVREAAAFAVGWIALIVALVAAARRVERAMAHRAHGAARAADGGGRAR